MRNENFFIGLKNRLLQLIAREIPGAMTTRVFLHKLRGVKIGSEVWIGHDTLLESSSPHLITIGNNVTINARVMIIAHYHGTKGVTIEDDVHIGPGSIIMPSVLIGKGSVVTAGSIVTRSVPPSTMVQGNPAKPIARCIVPLRRDTPMMAFYKGIKPIKSSTKDY